MAKPTPIENMFVFDLESCDGVQVAGEEVPRQRAWMCGFMNILDRKLIAYTSLEDCLKRLFKVGGNQQVEIAVHNLSFDGSFIVPALVALGYEPVQGKPGVGEFSVLIDDRNNWYTISLQISAKRRVLFWDSLKLFPMPLKHLHHVYHTKTKKIEETADFYNRIRPVEYLPDDDEIKYFTHDLLVLAETLTKHIDLYGLSFKKTQASQAFNTFSSTFKAWKLRFPALDEQVDEVVRPAYWGGISYVNPRFEGLDMEQVESYDINSSYPYQLATHKMPYGKLLLELGEGDHPYMGMFWVAKAIVRFDLKKDKIPCIPKKAIEQAEFFPGVKWMHTSDGLVELTFCSIDYLTILQSYDFEVIHWLWSLHWSHKVQKEIARYIHKNNDDKILYKELAKHTTGDDKAEALAKTQRAKINNNSFYGKFGEEILKIGKTPIVDDQGLVSYVEDREELLSVFRRKFLPLAIATTAHARQQFVSFANLMGSDFIYGDTDSCHFQPTGKPKLKQAIKDGTIVVDDLQLGAWSHDATYTLARYLRPKTYIALDKSGKWVVTCAGLPADKDAQPGEKKRSCCTWSNFHIGTVIEDGNGKLRTIATPTGKKLVPVGFIIGANNIFDF